MSAIAKTYNIAAQTCANYEYGSGKLSRFSTPVGYYQNGRHYYHITDYQGNVRCIVADNDSLVMAVHYYPGGSLFGETSGTWHNADLFQGGRIEKGYSHLFYDLQNRHYDPVIPHFNSIDSNAEDYTPFSPYIYGLANPVRYRDPDGNDAIMIFSGTTITISANIYLMGNLATEKLAQTYQAAIMNTWGKLTEYTYNGIKYDIVWDINVSVKKYDEPIDYRNGKNNYLNVVGTEDSYVTDTNRGQIRSIARGSKSFENDNPMPHEFGHLLGLKDRYDKITYESAPEYIGNIMAEKAGKGIPDVRNLHILFNRPLKYYHNSSNQSKALNWSLFNFSQWNLKWKINNTNRE